MDKVLSKELKELDLKWQKEFTESLQILSKELKREASKDLDKESKKE